MTVPSTDFVPVVPPDFQPFGRWMRATFRLFGAQAGVWIGQGLISLAMLGPFYLISIVDFVMRRMHIHSPLTPGIIAVLEILRLFAVSVVTVGMTYTALKQLRGETIQVMDFFRASRFYLPMFLLTILDSVVTIIGFALCCIPGIILGGVFVLSGALLMDRRTGTFKSLGLSFRIAQQDLPLFSVYFIVWFLVCQIVPITVIGIVFVIPLASLAATIAYYDLTYGLSDASSTPGIPAIPPTPPYQPPPQVP